MKFYQKILFLGLIGTLVSCVGGYSFTGASIAPEVRTYSVEAFQNRASIVQATLASDLTNDLVHKINSSTSLQQVNSNADVSFQGTITGYSISPTAIEAARHTYRLLGDGGVLKLYAGHSA